MEERAVNITVSEYNAVEQTNLTLSGTGLSVETGSGDLQLTINTGEGLLTAGAGTTGVNLFFDPGYPDFGYYVDIYGTASQINSFLAGSGGSYLVFNANDDSPTTELTLTLTVYDDTGEDPLFNTFVESGTNNVPLNVTPVQDAPIITGSIPLNIPSKLNAPIPSGEIGTLVSYLLINAIDADNFNIGIAITSLNADNGTWYYKLSDTWVLIESAYSEGSALLLPGSARLYFKPATDFEDSVSDAITFRAWDGTTGTAGSTANTTTNGGTTAFSAATDSADITMTPVDVTLAIIVQSTTEYGEGVYFEDIKAAYFDLFYDSNFYSTYVAPLPNKRLLVSVFEFAGGARQCFGWFLIDSATSASIFANLINRDLTVTLLQTRINLGQAIEFATGLIQTSGYDSAYNIINFCADGNEIRQIGTPTATNAAITALGSGSVDAINGISVEFSSGFNLFNLICPKVNGILNEEPTALQLSNYNNPVGQPGFANDGFSFEDGTYPTALAAKMFAEIRGTRPPSGGGGGGGGGGEENCGAVPEATPRKIGFTTHDRPIIIDNVTYQPWTSADPSAVAKELGIKVDDMELRSVLTTDSFDQQLLLNNGLRNARITTMPGINWRNVPETMSLIPDNEKEVGLVGQVRVLGKTQFAIENLSEASSRLSQPQVQKTSPLCNVRRFCDERCGLDIDDFRCFTIVDRVDSQILFTLVDKHDYSWGTIEFFTGENKGAIFSVADGEEGVINLLEMAEGRIQVGDEVIATRGCNRTLENCEEYENTLNFRGIPTGGKGWMPGADFYGSSPVKRN